MPENKEREDGIIYRSATVRAGDDGAPLSLNREAGTVEVDLATETPVREYDWNHGWVDTILLMSGAVYPKIRKIAMLDNHMRWSARDQIGSFRQLRAEGGRLPAVAHFAKSKTAQDIFDLVADGHVTDVSVGRRDLESVYIAEGTTAVVDGRSFTGPLKVVSKWEVKEGSWTPVGADPNAKARAASAGNKTMEETPMPDVNENGQARAKSNVQAPPAPASQPEAIRSAFAAPAAPAANPGPGPTAEDERARCADIATLGLRHNCMAEAEKAIAGGLSVRAFQAQVLDTVAERSERNAPGYAPRMEVTGDNRELFRSDMRDGILLRSNVAYTPEKQSGGDGFRGYTMREMARECLRRNGASVPSDPMEMVARAFTESASDFPHILAEAAHKAVIQGAQEAEETFGLWTGDSTANDFRRHSGVSLGAFDALELVPEGGEYRTGGISDNGIFYQVATYGKLFGITRQAVINDDVNAFTEIPSQMGAAAIRTCGNAVYDILSNNPQLADGTALFAAARGNLAASGGPINRSTYRAARVAMGRQRGEKNEVLNLRPAFLLAPVEREDEALMLMNSEMLGTAEAPNQKNPYRNAAQIVTEGRIDYMGANDIPPWFVVGPKGTSINCAWLFGNKIPRVESRQGWTVDGTQFKVSIDFGTYVRDCRALYKNPGN